jgi:hypothetical protein
MTTASGKGKGSGTLVLPVVAYAFVLALLGWAGFFLRGPSNPPGSNHASSVISKETPAEPLHAVQGLNLPPRPAEAEATASAKKETAQAPAVMSSPSPSEKSNSDVAAAAEPTKKEPAQGPAAAAQSEKGNTDLATSKQPEPPKTTCTVNVDRWPVDSTEQVKAIQILMRDLGFYSSTTYGTLGPATRAAIRKYQLATDQAETGEPSEMLFQSLKKKCT